MQMLVAYVCQRALVLSLQDDWLHLTGLIHDLGKVLAHPAFGSQPQWAVVGDTFPTGCDHDPCIVYHDQFAANPDVADARYKGNCGVYERGCGLKNVVMSWGHDEYLYQVGVSGLLLSNLQQWCVGYPNKQADHTIMETVALSVVHRAANCRSSSSSGSSTLLCSLPGSN